MQQEAKFCREAFRHPSFSGLINVDGVDFIRVEPIGPLWMTLFRRRRGVLDKANICFSVVNVVAWLSETVAYKKMKVVRGNIGISSNHCSRKKLLGIYCKKLTIILSYIFSPSFI